MEKRNSSSILIEVLLKAIDKIGLKKTIQVLQIVHDKTYENKQLIELVILNTCNHFGISEHTLIKGRKNIPERTNAIGVCAVLLLRLCNLSQREISELLKKDPTLINKYIHKFQSLDENFKDDKEVLKKMELISNESIKQQGELNK
jgi:hypothetical protein